MLLSTTQTALDAAALVEKREGMRKRMGRETEEVGSGWGG